ncbi:hypothetical protein ES703_40386 [subsurface metagenome]
MPYAAKAKIEHEFEVDHLNVWVTFRKPMDQSLKPPLSLWLLEADSFSVDIVDSAWQDEFTLLLTSDAVGDSPDRLLLEYSGPNSSLQTTWGKDWEPWGPILSVDLASYLRPSYVDRGQALDFDFLHSDFTYDGQIHDLDLSGIVPAGAVAVVLSLRIASPTTDMFFFIFKKSNGNIYNSFSTYNQVFNKFVSHTGTVGIDPDRVLSYKAPTMPINVLTLVVCGWFV